MGKLVYYEKPELRAPDLVMGFSGWPNAAEVATGVVSYLRDKLSARKFGKITPEEFYDFTTTRPLIVVEQGVVKAVKFPSNELYFWRNDRSEHDLILLLGSEPHLRWGKYMGYLLGIIKQFAVHRLYTVGGVYDRVPHTAVPPVSAVVSAPELKEELAPLELGWTEYQGPSSFHSTLLIACQEHKLPAVSIWGHAPAYVQAIRNPKVCHAVLTRLTRLLDIELDLGDLLQAAASLDATLSRLLKQNQELRRYVEQFEQEYERSKQAAAPPEADERIINEIEDFLKREQKRDKGQ